MLGGSFGRLRIQVLERHDLVLAKLARNNDRDRSDVESIASQIGLDIVTLQHRYRDELRYKFGRPEREDLTLQFWIEIIEEVSRRDRR